MAKVIYDGYKTAKIKNSSNEALTTSENNNPSWVYNKLGIERFHREGITGKNIKIAIGDSKSNKIPTGNEDKLKFYGTNIVGSTVNDHIISSSSIIGSKEFGIAPDSELYILNFKAANGDLLGLSQAINWCIDNNMDILLLVCGWKEFAMFNQGYADETTKAMVNEALINARNNNLKLIISEGNTTNSELLEYPQVLVNDFIRVGGCTEDYTYVTGCTISNFRGVLQFYDGVYKYNKDFTIDTSSSGTSFAAPIVTGIVALLLQQQPNMTSDEVRQYLYDTAYKPEGMNLVYDKHYGHGIAMPSFINKNSYKKQSEIDIEKEKIIPITSARLLNTNATYNESIGRYEMTIALGETVHLEYEAYPQNNNDYLRITVGDKAVLGEIIDGIFTPKEATQGVGAGFKIIGFYNCNNKLIMELKVVVTKN